MIAVGALLTDPEQAECAVALAVRDVARAAFAEWEPAPGVLVNVVFHLPGGRTALDFDAPRPGHFSRVQRMLTVQVPLSRQLADQPRAAILEQLILGLRQANGVAFDFFKQRGLDFPLDRAHGMVSDIETRLAEMSG